MKNKILLLSLALTCACSMSVASSLSHDSKNEVSKTQIVPGGDMSQTVDFTIAPAPEVIVFDAGARMSVSASSIIVAETAKIDNLKTAALDVRWQSTGLVLNYTIEPKVSKTPCTIRYIRERADA